MFFLPIGKKKTNDMRVLLNGKALAFQASHEGSIPFTRSNVQDFARKFLTK